MNAVDFHAANHGLYRFELWNSKYAGAHSRSAAVKAVEINRINTIVFKFFVVLKLFFNKFPEPFGQHLCIPFVQALRKIRVEGCRQQVQLPDRILE